MAWIECESRFKAVDGADTVQIFGGEFLAGLVFPFEQVKFAQNPFVAKPRGLLKDFEAAASERERFFFDGKFSPLSVGGFEQERVQHGKLAGFVGFEDRQLQRGANEFVGVLSWG